jgi:hypothetical protein
MKGHTFIVAVAAMSLLFGCQPKEPAASTLSVPPVEQCKASGGTIEKVGMIGTPACVIPTADAGKTCRDSGECQGRCLVKDWKGDHPPRVGTQSKGMCEASNLTFGCFAEIRRGRIATAFLCVD